jgi:hypothetical protein
VIRSDSLSTAVPSNGNSNLLERARQAVLAYHRPPFNTSLIGELALFNRAQAACEAAGTTVFALQSELRREEALRFNRDRFLAAVRGGAQ